MDRQRGNLQFSSSPRAEGIEYTRRVAALKKRPSDVSVEPGAEKVVVGLAAEKKPKIKQGHQLKWQPLLSRKSRATFQGRQSARKFAQSID
ncbi:MAG: hypothetical protein ACI8XX_000100 [Polaribacter sp.]|jgi:hypothetical protein